MHNGRFVRVFGLGVLILLFVPARVGWAALAVIHPSGELPRPQDQQKPAHSYPCSLLSEDKLCNTARLSSYFRPAGEFSFGRMQNSHFDSQKIVCLAD
jgi:hypothetical protein